MPKQQRVLIVRNAHSGDFGGAERYPALLGLEISKCGYDPYIGSSHRGVGDTANSNGFPTIYIPRLKLQNYSGYKIVLFPLYILWVMFLTLYYFVLVITHRIDILHLQSRDDFVAGTICGKLLRKRVVWTDHADLKYVYQNLGVWYKNPVGKIVFFISRFADSVIVVSNNEKMLIETSAGTTLHNNYIMIYNGVSKQTPQPIRSTPKRVITFISTSRLVRTKGIFELVAASQKLENEGFNFKVIALGDGQDLEELKSIAPSSVELIGHVEDVLPYVAGGDIFVLPTYNEAFSLSLLEATMIGKPIIATRVGGNPEVVTDGFTGILVDAQNTEQLYEAMKKCIADYSEVKKYGVEVRKKFLDEFQLPEIVRKQIIPLYNKN